MEGVHPTKSKQCKCTFVVLLVVLVDVFHPVVELQAAFVHQPLSVPQIFWLVLHAIFVHLSIFAVLALRALKVLKALMVLKTYSFYNKLLKFA